MTKTWMCVAAVVLAATTGGAYFNPIEGGATEVVTNQWDVQNAPWLYVGSNTGSNSLVVTRGGRVDNQVGRVGGQYASTDNRVVVTGAGASWNNTFDLQVGYNGASNTLEVVNGGLVTAEDTSVGYNSVGNTISVEGGGSKLQTGSLRIGHLAGGNTLEIVDGGALTSDQGSIGYWIGADGNAATVSGAGSLWTNTGAINVGEYGSGNELRILDGGRVDTAVLNLSSEALSTSNRVFVSGAGAVLNTSALNINVGANNVDIESGGRVAVKNLAIADDGNLNVNDGGTFAINNDFNASKKGFNFNEGGNVEVHGKLTGLSSKIEGGRTVTLESDQGLWSLPNSGIITAGNYSSGNSLHLFDGARVYGMALSVGTGPDAHSNQFLVSGPGSHLNSKNYLVVGNKGDANRLDIVDGANVYVRTHVYVGEDDTSANNSIVVSGLGSSLHSVGDVQVGYDGDDNQLIVEDQGVVTCEDFFLGEIERSSGNQATVKGTGSKISASQYGYIGCYGSDNQLEILNGASFISPTAWIGTHLGSTRNQLIISGQGSEWLGNDLVVGFEGESNDLHIVEGGSLTGSNLFVGGFSDFNVAHVSGVGSMVESMTETIVGYAGSHNTMLVEDGGWIDAPLFTLGATATADNNAATVTGEGSIISAANEFIVGKEGSDNTLTIADGGLVVSDRAYIGAEYGADNNVAIITGPGSVWSNQFLNVGGSGINNALIITNGGAVVSAGEIGIIGIGNEVVITGAGSSMSSSTINVGGPGGVDNSMHILDGAKVYSDWAGITSPGDANVWPSGSNNLVRVSGEGSTWDIDGGLDIAVGKLLVEDGGGLYSGTASVKGDASVDGSGSVWTNAGHLDLDDGSLKVSAGGSVVTESAYSSGQVAIEGAGSEWIVANELDLEGSLEIRDGGRVSSRGATFLSGSAVVVSGTGSRLDARSLYAEDDNGNTLIVTNGGLAAIEHVSLAGDGSTAIISGAGSIWSNQYLRVGGFGSDNSVQILDGASVYSTSVFLNHPGGSNYVPGGTNNSVLVSGAGSTWNVGELGMFNSKLSVEDGATVFANGGSIEGGAAVNVVGSGSVWSNASHISLRPSGSITARDGGKVFAHSAVLEYKSRATVSGWQSALNLEEELTIGEERTGSMLSVEDGGSVESGTAIIGEYRFALDNSAQVSGAGSYWSNRGLSVGREGSANTMSVMDGGVVQTWGSAYIGENAMAMSNSVTVAGADSAWGVGAVVPRMAFLPPQYFRPGQGYDGSWTNGGQLVIGYPGTNNLIIVTNGTTIATGGNGLYVSSGNQVAVHGGEFIGGVGGYTNGLVAGTDVLNGDPVIDGSVTIEGGVFTPITNMYAIEATLGDLSIGHAGSFNTLNIEDGGLVSTWNAFVGETSNAWFNAVSVTGTNSEFRVARDLSLGGRMSPMYTMTNEGWQNEWMEGGRGNALHVGDGALVSVGRDFDNRNYSSITLDSGARINVASNYYQDATSSLRFGVTTNAAGAPLNALMTVGGTAELEEGTRIEYASDVGQLEFETIYTNKVIEAGELIVAGKTNPNSLDLELLDASGTLVDVLFWENNADIYGFVGRKRLADSAGLSTNSMMGRAAREIDDMSLLGHSAAGQAINLLNNMSGTQQAQQLNQLLAQNAPTYMHGESMTEGVGEIVKRSQRFQAAASEAPEGAAGPYDPEQGLIAWVKPYGSWSDYSANNGFAGYDHNIYGTMVGFDKPLEGALLGLAGGYGRSNLAQDDGDSSQAKTGYGVIYLHSGTKDWFGHANLAFGRSRITDLSGTAMGNEAEYDASNFSTYLGGGKEIAVNRRFSVTPKASMLWTYYYQEGYTETSGLAREVSPYERNSLLSTLGGAVAYQKDYKTMVLKPEARLFWLHEFNSDEENVDYQFVGGQGGWYHFAMPAPEEDVIETGLGISALFNDELELVFDIDGRFGQNYSGYALSGRIQYEF